MSEYYWDNKIDYLKNTRWLYYNDDYLQFLVRDVWKVSRPVSMIDYGCGFGYLGQVIPDNSIAENKHHRSSVRSLCVHTN